MKYKNVFQENSTIKAKKSGVLPFRIDENGEIEFLLGLPGEPSEPHKVRPGFYGVWNIFKGHTDGEDVKTAAIREFCEETNLPSSLIRNDNFFDLGFVGKVYTYALDLSGYDIDTNSLSSNLVTNYLNHSPFPEIGKYGWFKLPITASIRKSAVEAMNQVTKLFQNKTMQEQRLNRIVSKVLMEAVDEITASHVSHAKFDYFSNEKFGSGEGKTPAHGYGVYVAIDPHSNSRYFLQSIRVGDKDKSKSHLDKNGLAQSYYYDVDIPDINESNYLYEKYPISKIPKQLEIIKNKLSKLGIDLVSNPYFKEDMACRHLLTLIGKLMSGDEFTEYRTVKNSPNSAASGLMASCGIVGMIYYGSKDKLCAVIFDPSQVKIKKRTSMRDEIGDIQPKNDSDRQRIKKIFANSDFYKKRVDDYKKAPFDLETYYNNNEYVDDSFYKDMNTKLNKYNGK